MKKLVRPFAVLSLLLPWLLVIGGPPESEKADAAPKAGRDVVDLVYLADGRPILLRFHVLIDGRPYRDAWEDLLTSLFRYSDADSDGVLSQAELDRMLKPQFLLPIVRGPVPDMKSTDPERKIPEVSVTLVPGKVTRDGLAQFYRVAGLQPFTALVRDETDEADALTDALFRRLDTNKDDKLSKEELLAAATSLRKLDLNDDEIISQEEILPPSDPMQPGMMAMKQKVSFISESPTCILMSSSDASSRLAYAMMERYDEDKNGKLSRTELKLDQAEFDKLDSDRDGELDTQELSKYFQVLPQDLELVVHLGGSSATTSSIYIQDPHGRLVGSTQRSDNLALLTSQPGLQMEVAAGQPPQFKAMKDALIQQFTTADAAKKDVVELAKLKDQGQLKTIFAMADRNGDGKLTRQELNDFLELMGKAASAGVVLTITDHGKGLFNLLDVYHDGKLRQRELRSAWTQLAPFCKANIGHLTKADVPHQLEILIGQARSGAGLPLGEGFAPAAATMAQRQSPEARGPLWFRKMDRNGDGVVSRREFLGSKEDFDKIDTNGDGLISPEEAEKYDASLRKSTAKAP